MLLPIQHNINDTTASDMRRWRGPVRHWTVEIRLTTSDDNNFRLASFLANLLDPTMESLAHFMMDDPSITNTPSYVWISDNDEVHDFNTRLRQSNTVASNMMTVNNLEVISIFTFVTNGPVGREVHPRT